MKENKKRIVIIASTGILTMIILMILMSVFQDKIKQKNVIPNEIEVTLDSDVTTETNTKNKIEFSQSIRISEDKVVVNNVEKTINKEKNKLFLNDTNNLLMVSKRITMTTPIFKDADETEKLKETNKITTEFIIDNLSNEKSYKLEGISYDLVKGVAMTDDNIYIIETNKGVEENKILISKFNEKNTNETIETKTINKADIENIVIFKDNLIYSEKNKLYKLDLTNLEKEELNLGGNIKDLYLVNNNIFILNDFGKGKNNSLLFKINADSFKVENTLQTKNKDYELKGLDFVSNSIILQNKDCKFNNNLIPDSFLVFEYNILDNSTNLNDTKDELEVFHHKYLENLDSDFFIIK